jgi:transcriptional regulator with XRE-family HTH domain
VDDNRSFGDYAPMVVPSFQVSFGRRVRALREAKGFSQETFAGIANIDRGAFGKIERGEINVGLISIARIAVALDMPLPELLQTIAIDPDEVRSIPRSSRGPKSIGTHI